jgi:hypothetical protein
MCRQPFTQARPGMKRGCDLAGLPSSPAAPGLCALFLLFKNTGIDRVVLRRVGLLPLALWNGHGLLKEEGLWAP